MNNMHVLLQLVTLLAALAIFAKLEPRINKMGPHCRISIRVAIVLTLAGALWLALAITQGYQPGGHVAVLVLGLAIWLWSDKRSRRFR